MSAVERGAYRPSDPEMSTAESDGYVTCQGCGAVRGISALGRGHACWRNEDGTYEEGGTFQ